MTEQTFSIWLFLAIAFTLFVESYVQFGLVFLGATLGLIVKAWYEE
jgi:hypothetical protein